MCLPEGPIRTILIQPFGFVISYNFEIVRHLHDVSRFEVWIRVLVSRFRFEVWYVFFLYSLWCGAHNLLNAKTRVSVFDRKDSSLIKVSYLRQESR